jgi:hypothetical protein
MRFADEPAERRPSRQITPSDGHSSGRVEKGEFDRAVERLTESTENGDEPTTAREAIRQATLLPPRKQPGWLMEAAARAARELES